MTSSSIVETSAETTGSQGGTQAVDRAAALLTYVVEADHPVTFAEASEASGLARSTTSRLLAALENNRLLERSATGEYVGGPLFVLLRRAPRPQRRAGPTGPADPRADRREHRRDGAPRGRQRRPGRPHRPGGLRPTSSVPATGPTSRSRRTARRSARCCSPGTCSRCPPAASRHRPAHPEHPRPTSTPTSRRCARAGTPSPTTSSRSAWPASQHRSSGRTGRSSPPSGVSGPTARLEDRLDELGRLLKDQTEALSELLRRGTHQDTSSGAQKGTRHEHQKRSSRGSTTRPWSATRPGCSTSPTRRSACRWSRRACSSTR